MLSKDDILKLETRRRLYNFILKNPGLHLREIKRRTNLPMGSLQYHIKSLNKYGIVVSKVNHGYIRFYSIKSVGNRDKEIINILRQEIPLRIILLLLTPGPGDIYKDKKTYKKSWNNPKNWEFTYSKKELIELTKHWGKSDNFDLDKNRTTVAFHLKKLIEADLIKEVKVGRVTKYKLKDEDMIIGFLIKYKETLSKKAVNELLDWKKKEYFGGLNNIEKVLWEVFPHPYYGYYKDSDRKIFFK